MPDDDLMQELRRYLRQRLVSGERSRLLTPVDAPASKVPESETPPRTRSAGAAAARLDGSPLATSASSAAASLRPAARRDTANNVVPLFPATPSAAAAVPATAPAGDSLERVAAEVSVCTRCRLHETRHLAVPGVGPADAGLVFVGEGPGADEDMQGEPFVGRAGQLLTKIIEAVHLRRSDVFITNIVKCRPPGNRDPQPDEIAACEPYLKRQLRLLQPQVICALGRHAGATLTGTTASMAALRSGAHSYEGIRVFPTYHPAALLRNPQWKRPVWEDIQNVRREYDRRRENI